MSDLPKHIRFVEHEILPGQKTNRWFVLNKHDDDELGEIAWYGPWRQYCFSTFGGTVYSPGCLSDIAEFCARKTNDHKFANGRVEPRKSESELDSLAETVRRGYAKES